MVDELVDVVNEKDEVVGQEMKNVCHEKGLLHRTSVIFLSNSKGEIWLQVRSKKKEGAGQLDASASGHVSAGEEYLEAAYKEMREELGIETELISLPKKIIEKYAKDGKKIKHIVSIYLGNYDGPFNLQEEEVESIASYSIEKIKEMLASNQKKFGEGTIKELELLLKIKNKDLER